MPVSRSGVPLVLKTMLFAVVTLCAGGCQSPQPRPAPDTDAARNERHLELFGGFDLPRNIGAVENIGLQLPVISPDGEQMLYLRTDSEHLTLMTLLGSADPRHTPLQGTLSVWIRSTEGANPGRPLSMQRWAHSPVWSETGHAAAYVFNEPPGSFIVHVDLVTGKQTILGVQGAINCLPRFGDDDRAILFCSGPGADGPFRICRQSIGDSSPTPLTPEGMDCLFPLAADSRGQVLCARVEGDGLCWTQAGLEAATDLLSDCGLGRRPDVLQTLAGIGSPLAPDGRSLLFYDARLNRISTYNTASRRAVRHRPASIAACWLSGEAIALATADGVFLVNTVTGLSPGLFNGAWIPRRYVPANRRLLLLGKDSARRFTVVEVTFKPGRNLPRTTPVEGVTHASTR